MLADEDSVLPFTTGHLHTSRNPPKRQVGVDRYRTFEEGAEKGRPVPCKFENYNENDEMEVIVQEKV